MPDATALRWTGADAFTAALWVRPGEQGADGGNFWQVPGDAVGALEWGLGIHRGRFTAFLQSAHHGNFGESVELADSATTPAGEWQHVAMASDGAECALYVNGTKVASRALGANRRALAPSRVEMHFGRPVRLSAWAFTGDLDEARVWRRALAPEEIARLASRVAPPCFVQTQSTYGDTDDFAVALQAEFGPEAALADWEQIKRLRADDPVAWADETGLRSMSEMSFLQRDGQRRFDEQRHYFMVRRNGTKPDYFLAHDELGGATLALGSWYGNRVSLLAVLPPAPPHNETLTPAADGTIRREGGVGKDAAVLALTWRFALAPDPARALAVVLRRRGGGELHAVCPAVGRRRATHAGVGRSGRDAANAAVRRDLRRSRIHARGAGWGAAFPRGDGGRREFGFYGDGSGGRLPPS